MCAENEGFCPILTMKNDNTTSCENLGTKHMLHIHSLHKNTIFLDFRLPGLWQIPNVDKKHNFCTNDW